MGTALLPFCEFYAFFAKLDTLFSLFLFSRFNGHVAGAVSGRVAAAAAAEAAATTFEHV